MRTLCLVPVFNQVRELPRVLAEIDEVQPPCDVLLVNNGSSDGSEVLIRESRHASIEFGVNRGVGKAIMASAEWALERDYDVLTGLAGNAKMLASEMHRLLDPIERGDADYVTGSRFLPGGESPNLPAFRRRAIPLTNHFVRAVTGARLTDMTCGYRAFRLDLLRRARFDWRAPWLETYGFEYYFYAKVVLDGSIRWREVPITMRYPATGRYSKIRPGRDWIAMLKPWVRARLDGKGFAPPSGITRA